MTWIPAFIIVSLVITGAVQDNVRVFSVGDSTMANFSTTSDLRRGWMQNMGQFFNDAVRIANYAASGRSSKSFIDEGKWASAIRLVNPGDYVIIQFGHNDEKDDTTRHTDPWTTYTENLRKFVAETRQKGGCPILCTPIVRRYFNADGTIINSHGEYPDAVRKLAADSSVTLVDMEALTAALMENAGPDSSKKLYNYVEPGESELYPNGNTDDTHLNDRGATAVALLFTEDLKAQEHPLSDYLISASSAERRESGKPERFRLVPNYPNPFNPETRIAFYLPENSKVKLEVFNSSGKRVRILINDLKSSGKYSIPFDASGLPSGLYIYQLSSNNCSLSGKMLLLK